MLGCAVSVFLSIVGAVYLVYPDRVAYPREFEDGLERELGGSGTMRARKAGDPEP
jgi:NADH dehydrogenase (ubiquinone) 1 beta subcomplex subunit 8